jgi:hypothetical protein
VPTTVATLAATLQTLFTTTATALGRATGFVRRRRAVTAAGVVRALVFGWIDDPRAPLESFAARLGISPQALHQRLTPAAHAFLRDLLAAALRPVHAARPTAARLLRPFRAVVVEDATLSPRPADLAAPFRGHGGSDGRAGQAALKVVVRRELLTGQLLARRCVPGVTNDAPVAATAADLPAGALHLADQGFFDAGRWRAFPADRFWISRVPAGVAVAVRATWVRLADRLRSLPADGFDGPAGLVERQGLLCRLTARRCPPAVAARRRQKLRAYARDKKGREPSARQLVACDWLALATNVPADRLTAVGLWVAYRCRWQIELLFKRGKQRLGWAVSHGRRGARVAVEVLAQLLGFVVVHWATLWGGGPLAGGSAWKRFRAVRRFALRLWDDLRGGRPPGPALALLARDLGRVRPPARRHTHPGTRQLLHRPSLAA